MRPLNMSLLTLLLFLFGLTCNQVLAEQVSDAIISGEHAPKGHFKYLVYVKSRNNFCGGAIIADQYILTAAHCFTEGGPRVVYQGYDIVAGTHNLHDLQHAITVRAETVYIHKQYNPHTLHNDLAIVKLKHGLDLRKHEHKIKKIKLPTSVENLVGVDAVIAGFGLQNMRVERKHDGSYVEKGGTTDEKLRYAHVKVYPQIMCVAAYPDEVVPWTVICGQVHQRHGEHYKGVCNGDSGSPLVHGHEVIGILSARPFACNETTMPSKYTRVDTFIRTINNVMNGKPDSEVIPVHVP